MRVLPVVSLLVACGSFACGARTLESGPSDAFADVADVADASDATDATDATDAFTSCGGPGTCVLVPKSCCGSCGAATPSDMIGVAMSAVSTYRSSVCEGMGCPACYMEQDPFLVAFCESGSCLARNLHVDALTACATDADCQLRYSACCAPCGTSTVGLLALRVESLTEYRSLVCAPATTCPACPTGFPPGYRAYCDPSSHCAVAPPR